MMILSLVFLLMLSLTAAASATVTEIHIDKAKDNSISKIVGVIHLTGSGGTAAGFNPEKTIREESVSVTESNPKTDEVQAFIDEIEIEVYNTTKAVMGRGKKGEYHIAETTKLIDEWNNEKIDTVYSDGYEECKIEDLSDGSTKYYLKRPGDTSPTAWYVRDENNKIIESGGNDVGITLIRYIDYGKETLYRVESVGWVSGYDIIITDDGNGTGTPSSSAALQDDEITLTSKPNSGYQFKEWQVISGGVTITNNTFIVGTADVEIKAIFEKTPTSSDPDTGSNPDSGSGQQQQQEQQENPPAGQQPPQEEQPQTEAQPGQQEQQSDERIVFSKLKKAKVKAVSKKKIKVSWKKLSKKVRKEVKKIQIQVSTDPEFQTILKTKLVSSKKKSCTISGLKKNTKYFIRIRAYTEKDGLKYVSEWVTKSKKTKKK